MFSGVPDILQENTSAVTQHDHPSTISAKTQLLNTGQSYQNNSRAVSNDVIRRFNITSPDVSNDVTMRSTTTPLLDNAATEASGDVINDTLVAGTTKPVTFSHKPIYIRGHLLYHPSPWPRKHLSKPVKESHDALRAPEYTDDFWDATDGTNSRTKRKHGSSRDLIQNYKIMYNKNKVCVIGARHGQHYNII